MSSEGDCKALEYRLFEFEQAAILQLFVFVLEKFALERQFPIFELELALSFEVRDSLEDNRRTRVHFLHDQSISKLVLLAQVTPFIFELSQNERNSFCVERLGPPELPFFVQLLRSVVGLRSEDKLLEIIIVQVVVFEDQRKSKVLESCVKGHVLVLEALPCTRCVLCVSVQQDVLILHHSRLDSPVPLHNSPLTLDCYAALDVDRPLVQSVLQKTALERYSSEMDKFAVDHEVTIESPFIVRTIIE